MSLSVLEERIAAVPAFVERALSAELSIEVALSTCARWISTGAGASEGPARLFAMLLRERGIIADYAPISTFIASAPKGDACLVVSQSLSPNARFPLARASAYAHTVLVTTRPDAPSNGGGYVHLIQHGPEREDGLLLRVIGPAAANASVIRLASHMASCAPSSVASVLATSRTRALGALAESGADAAALFDVAGIVATGEDVALVDGLRHKLLEGLGRVAPVWDLCALVHGPLQSFYEGPATLVSCRHEGRALGERSAARELDARLGEVLDASRHRVVRLASPLPGALALLDFDLQLDHLVLEALRARPRDLAQWPGKGRDGALYDLGPV